MSAAQRMSLPERRLWERFLLTPEGQSREWLYEFELGVGSYGPAQSAQSVPDFYLRLLRKRIDAYSPSPSPVILAEVKEVGGMAALGQLLTYRDLLLKVERPTGLVALWVVCGRVDYDVQETFRAFGVRVFVV